MLIWSFLFLIVAAVAGLLPGLGLISGTAAGIAWGLFVLFAALTVATWITSTRYGL